MPNTNLFYRLRIRAADDLSDSLVISSVPGGTNPYILKPFSGAGRSFDPLSGSVDTGAYTVEVIDAVTGANTRVVTAALADANARQQLLSRRAYGEYSNNGSSWTPLFGGYVNAVRLVSSLVYAISIGETRRISADRDIFKSTALSVDFTGKPVTFSQFDKTTCIFGGPIRGDWLWVRDWGGWRYKVTQALTGPPKYVQMKLLRAFDPTKPEHGSFSTLSTAIVDSMTARARPYYRESPIWKPATIRGHFPGILYRVQTVTGTLVGNYTPLSEPVHPDKPTAPDIFTRNGESAIWVAWTGTLPSVGDQYNVYMYPTDVSEDNPLHIFEHPVDLRTKLWDEAGIAYDSSVTAAVRAAIGDEVRLALRITRSPGKLKDFEQTLNSLFGMATRSDGAGREVLFSHRIKLSSSPGSTIALNDLRDAGGTVFDLDESTVCNKVTIKQKRLVQRTASDESTVDGIIAVDQAITVNNSDADITAYGDKEQVYEIEGQILTNKAQQDFDLEKYTLGVAREIFDRYGRGAIGGELHCLPSVTVDVGQEVIVNIPQLPNAVVGASPVSQRGGNRIVQVVKRTERPSGPDLSVLDSGTTAQPGTVPTFSIAANANDGFHFADLVITNAATLAAAGYQVRIEIGVGSSTPTAGTLLSVVDPGVVTSLTIPAHDSGTKVWARMRSEKEGYRPSAWTAFSGQQLTTLDAVTGLACSAEDAADPSQRTLTWTIGANAADYPVEVFLRLTADASTADRLVAILPAGSNRYTLTELDIANRTATVRHRERAPFNGVSADATVAVNTVGAAATLPAPVNPVGFSSKTKNGGVLVAPGTYGIDVNAAFFPCGIEIAVAVGGGGYETREIVEAAPFGPTRWSAIAPNDGQVRHIKARHVLAGYTSSAYCTPVDVTPWVTVAKFPHFFSSDGLRPLFDSELGEVTDQAYLANGVQQQNGTNKKNIASGRQTIGNATHGQSVTFPNNYQNPPAVNIFGGVSYEPASVWASSIGGIPGSSAPASTRQIDDVVAYNVTASGCSLRGILKQAGTSTGRSDAYAGGAITTIGGDKEVTTASAPAANDTYTSDYTYSFTLQGTNGVFASQTAVVSLDFWNGSAWVDDVATNTYSGGDDTFPFVLSGSDTLVATQTGLTGSSKWRIRIKSHTRVGGLNPLTRSVDPGNCTYTTATGEQYADKTPSSGGVQLAVLNVEIIGAS